MHINIWQMWYLFIMQKIILRGYFMNIALFKAVFGKKINIHCELVTSQPHWFSGSQLDIFKFSVFNNFLVYSLDLHKICTKQFGFRNAFILVKV